MSVYKTDQQPDDPNRLPPARRRRAKRSILPSTVDKQDGINTLAQRTLPTIDYFLFTLVSAALIAVGLLSNAPALVLLGALAAPLLTPLVGLALGTISGSVRFFFRSLAAMLLGAGMAFTIGVLSGIASRALTLPPMEIAPLHTQLNWHNFLVLALGAILTTSALVDSEKRAIIPNIALAYQIYTPIVAAGIGVGTRNEFLYPDGLVVFVIFLAWGTLLGAMTLAVRGFRPLSFLGYTVGSVFALVGIVVLIGFGSFGAAIEQSIALPTPVPTSTFTPTPTLTATPSPTASLTPIPPTHTPTASITPSPVPSNTPTLVPSPTPVYAIVDASRSGGDGARIRADHSFNAETLIILRNGTLIEIISDSTIEQESAEWVLVRGPDGTEGWMVKALLVVATPSPNW